MNKLNIFKKWNFHISLWVGLSCCWNSYNEENKQHIRSRMVDWLKRKVNIYISKSILVKQFVATMGTVIYLLLLLFQLIVVASSATFVHNVLAIDIFSIVLIRY